MNFSKISLALSAATVFSLTISCAKNFGDEVAPGISSEADLNAPVDGSQGQVDTPPPQMQDPAVVGGTKEDFSYVDPNHMVPAKPLANALNYYDANYNKIMNKNYIVVIDFTQNASQKRMYLIDMKTGAVTRNLTAAGAGSDPDGDGNATQFSNTPESKKSSLGYYITGETYQGSHGLSLRLHGMSTSNSNAFDRAIVMHGADYVKESDSWAGRSWGCPAVDNKLVQSHIGKIKNGALIYAWHAKYSLN